MSPSEKSTMNFFVGLPWVLKPFYGLISDSFSIFSYRRKSYLIILNIASFLIYILISLSIESKMQGLILLTSTNFCCAFSNVIGEAMIVEISNSN